MSIRRHIKMASETKIQEEKEEEELSLVSTKVPKARVRLSFTRALRRSFSIHVFLFSLCVAQKTNFPWKRWLLFSLCSSLTRVVYITRGGEDAFLSFSSLCVLSPWRRLFWARWWWWSFTSFTSEEIERPMTFLSLLFGKWINWRKSLYYYVYH